jgi:hypothetical protein
MSEELELMQSVGIDDDMSLAMLDIELSMELMEE